MSQDFVFLFYEIQEETKKGLIGIEGVKIVLLGEKRGLKSHVSTRCTVTNQSIKLVRQ